MSELFHRIRRPSAVLAGACLLRLALLTSRLNEGSQANRWLDILLWLVITCSLVLIGHRAISCLSRTSGARRGLLIVVLTSYTLWWSTLLASVALNTGGAKDPSRLLASGLFLIRSQNLLGPYLAPALIVTCALLVVTHVASRQPSMELPFPFANESPNTRRLINCLAYCAPGLFLFSRQSLDLIARQHVERVSYNRSGNVVTLVGPLLTTFLWAALTAITLGYLIFLGVAQLCLTINKKRWVLPSYRSGFVAMLALSFVVRLGTLLAVAPTRTDGGDPLFYHSTANFLATGHGFPEPLNFIAFQNWRASALHGPLYPLVLSFISRLGGTTYFDHKVFSLIIGTALVAMIGLVAHQVAPRPSAQRITILAMFLAAIYPNLWLVDGVMFPEGLMALCTTATVYAAYRWKGKPTFKWAAAMGLLVGLAALTRGEGLLLSVLLVVPWILFSGDLSWRTRIKHIALAGIACILVLTPWTLRNARSFEVLVPLSTNGNELFVYANCDPAYSGKFIGFWSFACQEDLRAQGIDATGDEAQKSLFWRSKGFDYASEHISELPKVVAARVGRQWELFRPWQNTEFAPIEGRNKNAARAGLLMYYVLAASSIYGAILIRRRRAGLLPLGALFINVTLTAIYAYGTTRFRVPAEPALCVLAAVGGYPLLQRLRARYAPRSPRHNDEPATTRANSFVQGATIDVGSIVSKQARATWASLGVVALTIAVTLPALYRAIGSSMEEGFMLVFPERVIKGAVANVDFLHLYGPGSLHVLSLWYRVFDVSLISERTFGLAQHLLVIFGLVVITRPWGKKASTLVGCMSTIFVLTPIGLQALAWSGGVGIALWSVIFCARAINRQSQLLPTRTSWVTAGLLAGLALTFRPDLVLALALVFGWALWKRSRRIISQVLCGFAVGLTSLWIHLIQAGPSAIIRGVLLDPVIHLRPGRELPRPPNRHYLQGALQVISEKFAPWWGVPHLSAPQQLFVWFFLLPVIALLIAVIAFRVIRRSDSTSSQQRGVTLFIVALFGIGLLPQALQRPDSAHLLWVSCISWPVLIIALIELIRHRAPRTHPTVRLVTAFSVTLAVVVIFVPFYTLRTYTDLAWRSMSGKTEVLQVTRGDRYFYLGDDRPYMASLQVVKDLDQLSHPGERLLVGPVDLRNTSYSDAFFYHLFPDLIPATYFIEMDPGLADRADSRLADDVQSADWLILTRFWSGWIEPNESTKFGSDVPNQVVENSFCLRGSYQHDLVRLYQKCSTGDGIGPYDAPYEPLFDYAVEVLVPVTPRPDGTCTPTCRGIFNPNYANIDTSVVEVSPKASDATADLVSDATP